MKKILPILMLLIGTGAGVGAGVFLRPEPAPKEVEATEDGGEDTATEKAEQTEDDNGESLPIEGKEYVKLSNQFVVPIVEGDRISSMVVMTLSVEAPLGQGEIVFDIEPKIRDVFLRVLFDHATVGGFSGSFLTNENLDTVRNNLRDAAKHNFGADFISDVLIFEIARQDY